MPESMSISALYEHLTFWLSLNSTIYTSQDAMVCIKFVGNYVFFFFLYNSFSLFLRRAS